MKVILEERGWDVHPESEVGHRAIANGLTNHRYFTELPGRTDKEVKVYMEFTFHDWSTVSSSRKHMKNLKHDPDKVNIHVEESYEDPNGFTWRYVQANGFIDGELGIKAIEQYIREHGYPDAEIQIKKVMEE